MDFRISKQSIPAGHSWSIHFTTGGSSRRPRNVSGAVQQRAERARAATQRSERERERAHRKHWRERETKTLWNARAAITFRNWRLSTATARNQRTCATPAPDSPVTRAVFRSYSRITECRAKGCGARTNPGLSQRTPQTISERLSAEATPRTSRPASNLDCRSEAVL